MPPGALIRRLFGPYEHQVAEAYRHIFVNLDDFARLIQRWVPQTQRVLEVGCGEGAMTERITKIYPAATVTAIDITPKVGRMFRGNRVNVTFLQESVESVAERGPASYDLVILADVIHHVPLGARRSLMRGIARAMTSDGNFIFKDWLATKTPINWLCGASDRYLTGDNVSYLTMSIIEELVSDAIGPNRICQTARVRPWDNNVAVLVRQSACQ
jgi:2-polyprenyl-3-methyl-5-hydroxy-6-metoxy-1,4-benzoquinol methylase